MRTQKNKKILAWATEYDLIQSVPKDFYSSEGKDDNYIWHGIPEDPNYFDDVLRLDLSHRGLYALPDDFFDNFIFLRELNLSNNKLYYLPESISFDLETLNLKGNENTIRLHDNFNIFENLKSLEVLHAGRLGKALRCSQDLKEKLLSLNIGLAEEDFELEPKLEPFIVNKETYIANEQVITIMIESANVIHEHFFVPEMKFSELDNDQEIALEMQGYLEAGSINEFNKDIGTIKQLSQNVKILLRPFSYNLSMNLKLAEGRISSYQDRTTISIYVSKDIIHSIIEEFNKGETKMSIHVLCDVYTKEDSIQDWDIPSYENDIVLSIAHTAVLARYATKRILMRKESYSESS